VILGLLIHLFEMLQTIGLKRGFDEFQRDKESVLQAKENDIFLRVGSIGRLFVFPCSYPAGVWCDQRSWHNTIKQLK